MRSGAGQCLGKLLIIIFIMAVLLICSVSNSLSLVSFRDHASTPVAIGQLFLMLTLPAAVTGIFSFLLKLVREGTNVTTERQLSSPALTLLALLDAALSAGAECLFVLLILPKAQGSVTIVLLAFSWNFGPLLLLIRENFTTCPQAYTPFGIVTLLYETTSLLSFSLQEYVSVHR